MNTRIWFENGAIQMDGVGSLPARSLTATISGDRVVVQTMSGNVLAQLTYDYYATKANTGFASATAAKAYLDGEFGKYVPVPSTVTPAGLGTAAVGVSDAYAREDHVHAKPAGLLTLAGIISVGESALVTVSLAVRRYTAGITGLLTTDRVVAMLNGVPQNGSLQDVYVSAANTLNVGVLVPALGVASTVSVPIAVYKVT